MSTTSPQAHEKIPQPAGESVSVERMIGNTNVTIGVSVEKGTGLLYMVTDHKVIKATNYRLDRGANNRGPNVLVPAKQPALKEAADGVRVTARHPWQGEIFFEKLSDILQAVFTTDLPERMSLDPSNPRHVEFPSALIHWFINALIERRDKLELDIDSLLTIVHDIESSRLRKDPRMTALNHGIEIFGSEQFGLRLIVEHAAGTGNNRLHVKNIRAIEYSNAHPEKTTWLRPPNTYIH